MQRFRGCIAALRIARLIKTRDSRVCDGILAFPCKNMAFTRIPGNLMKIFTFATVKRGNGDSTAFELPMQDFPEISPTKFLRQWDFLYSSINACKIGTGFESNWYACFICIVLVSYSHLVQFKSLNRPSLAIVSTVIQERDIASKYR